MEVISKAPNGLFRQDNAQVSRRKPVTKYANLVSQNSDLLELIKFHKIIIKQKVVKKRREKINTTYFFFDIILMVFELTHKMVEFDPKWVIKKF